jgi:hypothetical protein
MVEMIRHAIDGARYTILGAVLCTACGGSQEPAEQPQPATVAVVVPASFGDDKDASAGEASPDKASPDKASADRAIAESAGILGLLSDSSVGLSGIFGDAGDANTSLGTAWGSAVGDSFGAGGLGLTGIGRGGGGTGEGIGLGSMGTIGRGSGGGQSSYGSGSGRSQSRVRTGRPVITGALDKEIIRRIIRRHLNQIRYCYQKELATTPDLAGRVAIRFTIGPNGNVIAAQDAGSTLPDKAVVSCVERTFRRMMFPKPTGGGVVIVTYPLVFTPAVTAPSADAGVPAEAGADATTDR